jgi:hypothetical protein
MGIYISYGYAVCEMSRNGRKIEVLCLVWKISLIGVTVCKMVSWMCYRLHSPVTIHVQHPRAMTRTDYMKESHAAVMRLTGLWTPVHRDCVRDMWYSWHAGSLHEKSTCNITGALCHVTHAGQGNLYCVHDTVLHAVGVVLQPRVWII